MEHIYILEKMATGNNFTHTKMAFKTKKELFEYLLDNEETIFNYGFKRSQLLITEVKLEE